MNTIGQWAARINAKYKEKVICTYRKQKKIRVVLWNDYGIMTWGDAYCKKGDQFDINIGRAIAIAKALEIPLHPDLMPIKTE